MIKQLFSNNRFKNLVQWVLAAFIAFCVANILILPYWKAPGWISRDTGATSAVYHSGTTLVNGYEGYGILDVDSHGYLNEDLPLADSFVLALGCSHTKAIEVSPDERYTSILNEALSGRDDSSLYVYNLAIDGFYFPDIVKGFEAALAEFPGAETIIIEIPTTDFDLALLTDAVNSRTFDPAQTGALLYETQSMKEKIKIGVKESLPILSLYLSKQFTNLGFRDDTPFLYCAAEPDTVQYNVTKEAYLLALEPALAHLRESYDKEIIIYFHPFVEILETGELSTDTSVTINWFAESCDKYGITFLDATEAFLQNYENNHTVPYGFSNTSPGAGHLNKEGHLISARLLLEALMANDVTGENS